MTKLSAADRLRDYAGDGTRLGDDVAEVLDELDDLRRIRAQRDVVLSLHRRVGRAFVDETRSGGTKRAVAWRCSTCHGDDWPCATTRALSS